MVYRNISDYENFRATLEQECDNSCFLILVLVPLCTVFGLVIGL